MGLTTVATAQNRTETGMYFVGFSDKAGSPGTIEDPSTYLSTEAILRRARHGAIITETDLPLTPNYVEGVQGTGAKLWLKSKWMNGVVVAAAGPEVISLRELPFVDTVYYVAPVQYERAGANPVIPSFERPAPKVDTVPVLERYYGYGWTNLQQMNGDSLHQWGYRGDGVLVGVLDGGFPYVGNRHFLGYDDEAAIPANYDVVAQDETALDGGTHGATVLSTMATFRPFLFVGTAPAARYVLFTTENGKGEHRLEEINYAVALELADSAGVDIVNSSLGYSEFGEKGMNYTYADLTGEVSPASRAATTAFARGMILVTSAGNSGGDKWKFISIPADAKDIFAIGALNRDGSKAYFSSFGPTADGRIKPDVSALGVDVAAMTASGRAVTGANGTSLASPLVTGLLACLIQAFPDATNQEILDAVRQTADQADAPDNERGYGRPDFAAAYRLLESRRM
ncbi:hypothetical protein A3850_009715 [Lewinella sp. 4G2]|nr:hypothetical protein A3850_009715 [Lewinella sp. 4G2]